MMLQKIVLASVLALMVSGIIDAIPEGCIVFVPGLKGATGATGSIGPAGQTGPTGVMGSIGPEGARGITGSSLFSSYVSIVSTANTTGPTAGGFFTLPPPLQNKGFIYIAAPPGYLMVTEDGDYLVTYTVYASMDSLQAVTLSMYLSGGVQAAAERRNGKTTAYSSEGVYSIQSETLLTLNAGDFLQLGNLSSNTSTVVYNNAFSQGLAQTFSINIVKIR